MTLARFGCLAGGWFMWHGNWGAGGWFMWHGNWGLGCDSCETEFGGWGDSWHDLILHGEESDSELIKCTSTESE